MKYDDKQFARGFFESLETGDPLGYLIDTAPAMLGSNLSRQEKLNHLLFMSQLVQNTGTAKYGVAKLARKVERVRRVTSRWLPSAHTLGTFVDVGCGAHDPVALSAYMYGMGFSRGLGVDLAPLRNPAYSALSMLNILATLQIMPEKYVAEDMDRSVFLARMSGFDVARFAASDFFGGIRPMKGKVDYINDDVVNSGLVEGEASVIASFAVFEHVADVPGVLKFLHTRTVPGGIGIHFIDLRDHRVYRKTADYDEFSFLTTEISPKNLNRLRCSQMIDAFEDAGFIVLDTVKRRKPLPPGTRNQLLEQFACMSDEDLETVALFLVTKRPISS